jgi:hypothetical protein
MGLMWQNSSLLKPMKHLYGNFNIPCMVSAKFIFVVLTRIPIGGYLINFNIVV